MVQPPSTAKRWPDAAGRPRVDHHDDGAQILFELRGRTVFNADRSRGGQGLLGLFESADERYAWLNDVVCIAEGVIRPEPNRIEVRVFEGVNELLE